MANVFDAAFVSTPAGGGGHIAEDLLDIASASDPPSTRRTDAFGKLNESVVSKMNYSKMSGVHVLVGGPPRRPCALVVVSFMRWVFIESSRAHFGIRVIGSLDLRRVLPCCVVHLGEIFYVKAHMLRVGKDVS